MNGVSRMEQMTIFLGCDQDVSVCKESQCDSLRLCPYRYRMIQKYVWMSQANQSSELTIVVPNWEEIPKDVERLCRVKELAKAYLYVVGRMEQIWKNKPFW